MVLPKEYPVVFQFLLRFSKLKRPRNSIATGIETISSRYWVRCHVERDLPFLVCYLTAMMLANFILRCFLQVDVPWMMGGLMPPRAKLRAPLDDRQSLMLRQWQSSPLNCHTFPRCSERVKLSKP